MGRTKSTVDVVRVLGQKVSRPEYQSFLKENMDLFVKILNYEVVTIPTEELAGIKGIKKAETEVVVEIEEGEE